MMEYSSELIKELITSNCIKIGRFTLKNGATSKYYFDMKNLISYPRLLKKVGDAIYPLLGDFDIICGIPYGALPLATYISVQYDKPLIYIRDKKKEYGTNQQIEGEYTNTSRCVILDDVMTTGGSLEEVKKILEDKVTIVKCAVILDRQQSSHMDVVSLLTKTDITKYRLQWLKTHKKSNLCFSADLLDLPKLWQILDTIGPFIVICKIHFDMIPDALRSEYKDTMIELSIKHDFLIMEDRKFNDISFIVKQQYHSLQHWVDLVTVHTLVSNDVIQQLSGVVLVANMSNNTYDFSEKACEMANEYIHHVVGFVTQQRIKRIHSSFVCMTPGISLKEHAVNDQKYRRKDQLDTDIVIVGRTIYQSDDVLDTIHKLL